MDKVKITIHIDREVNCDLTSRVLIMKVKGKQTTKSLLVEDAIREANKADKKTIEKLRSLW